MKAPQNPALTAGKVGPLEQANKAEIIVEAKQVAKYRPCAFLAVMAIGAVTFFFGLGNLALVGPDEPRYAEVAREMFATGDYISTRLCGCLWFEKPALLYWMSAASYHLFGVNEFAARFPSALMALATVALLYFVLLRVASKRIAIAASSVLATCGIFIGFARVATPDMVLTASMSLALLSGYLAIVSDGRARLGLWALSFAAMGLAMLAKGLVGIVLVIAILAVYILIARQLKAIQWKAILMGLAVFAAVAAAWYVPVTLRHGWEFVEEFFISHHFQRYTSNKFGHPQPFYFFFLIAIAGTLPWMFFLIPATSRLRQLKLRADGKDSLLVFAWIWVAVPLLFFSLSESKLPGYILPVFPALAIIVGFEVERFWGGERNKLSKSAAWLTSLLLPAIGIAFIVYMNREAVSASGFRIILFALPLAFGAIACAALFAGRARDFIMSAALVVAAVIIGTAVLLIPKLNDQLSLKSLSLRAAAALKPNERIAFFIKKEYAPVFYAEGRVVCGVGDESVLNALSQDVLADVLQSEPSLIVITVSDWRDSLINDPRFTTDPIGEQGKALAYRVSIK